MLGKCLQILLTGSILACPFMCEQGISGCAEQVETPACCGGCAPRSPEPATGETPVQPCDDCQCICGGAIFNVSSQYELLRQFAFAAELYSFLGESVPAASPFFDRQLAPDRFPDDRLAESGRSIRCRHMSFLC